MKPLDPRLAKALGAAVAPRDAEVPRCPAGGRAGERGGWLMGGSAVTAGVQAALLPQAAFGSSVLHTGRAQSLD